MAWRNPFFCFLHSWRLAGGAALVANSEATGFSVKRLVDDQKGPLFKWSAAATNNEIVADRGGGSLEAVNRLLIPATHNLSGKTVVLQTNTTDSWPGTARVSVVAGAGVISESFTSTTDRFHRIQVTESHQGQIGEIFVTRDRTLLRGPEPDWVDEFVPNIIQSRTRSGARYKVLGGAQQREIEYIFRKLSAADKTVFDDMRAAISGGLFSFWLFTADDSAAPIYMQLNDRTRRRQDSLAPRANGELFQVTLDAIEVIQ